MAAQRGTTRAVVLAALTALFRARTELDARVDAGTLTIFDPPGPADRTGLVGADGASVDLLWCQDSDRGNDLEVVVLTGGAPVVYDETVRVLVVIQSLSRGSSATQAAADENVEEIFGEVLGALAGGPDVLDGNGSDPSLDGAEAVVSGFRSSSGHLPDGSGFGTRFEVEVEVEARFEIS